ncbi:ATP-binding cassette domain-containing protein [Streptomyces sp. SBST2-5]|uniref:ATP-binding cassette domain-containing protein n=1 Tax=Streptomyces composti TaxID=2720025 RepID=A0ABX1A755_9ACTN|nr:ATP-binding cassette domain-containing protein [Streptomyces composti]NJP51045.1 ATP-binding cassette domain-containing protein [Streptomyces composti]
MGGVVGGPPGLAVSARDFGLKGPRGWVFRGITVEAEPGSLITVAGPSGSGRTCLLLALTGRMKPTAGSASVGGHELPKRMAALRRVSALAHVTGVTDLDPALTVGEHLRERALLQRRFTSLRALLRPRRERAARTRRDIEAALTAAGLDIESLPKGARTAVRDLERTEALRLSLALALIGRPRLLGVDDTDLKLSAAERAEIWNQLRSLTERGITVVAVCSEPPEDAVVVRTDTGKTGRTGQTGQTGEADSTGEAGEPGDTAGAGSSAGAGSCAGGDGDGGTSHKAGANGGSGGAGAAGTATETATGTGTRTDTTATGPADEGDHAEKEAADALAETGRS